MMFSRLAVRRIVLAALLLASAQLSIVRASAVIYIPVLSGGLQVFDTVSDKVIAQPLLSVGDKSTAAISNPSGAYLLSGREVLRFDGRTNVVVGSIGMGREGTAFALVRGPSPFERIYVANGSDNVVTAINLASNTILATVPVGVNPVAVATSVDERSVYAANQAGNTVSVIDVATNTVTATIPVGLAPSVLVVSPDGQRVVVANQNGNSLSVINAASNTVQSTVSLDGSPSALAFSPDGTKLYAAVYYANQPKSHIAVINTATNAVITTIVNIDYRVNGIAVTPDGKKVYASTFGKAVFGTLNVISAASNTLLSTLSIGGAFGISNIIQSFLPPALATLENPQPDSFQSGIGLISGWSCLGSIIEIIFDDKFGPPYSSFAPYGSHRADTLAVCGNVTSSTGFGLLVNYNNLGPGRHKAQLYVNYVPQEPPVSFTVTVPAGEFLTGAAKEVQVKDFPSPGRNATLIWQESQQNFAIKAVTP